MKYGYLAICLLLVISSGIKAQSPGLIVRPAGGNGITPLNPNGDGFSSATSGGFVTSDITQSEIPYKIVPPAILEPVSDLLRGPGGIFSDLVREVDGSGFYVYNDGTNLLLRLRIGDIISGSKGYSVLIDTDGKMGNTGVYADPNYQAATTGSNGNPGFELEIVLETNFRVAVYNVDGTSTPVLINSYSINTNSQISAALSTVSNTRDYFYDFYVPNSVLGISASTPIRLTATTVMAPMAAIGGPKSDIYGVDDAATNNIMESWETAIISQPAFTLNDITGGGSGVSADCTAAPVLTGPVVAGSGITVSGTWTALDVTKPSTATITLYKNGVSAGTTTVSTGNTWNITGITISNGDILYAKAQATGETECLQSNNVKVTTCSAANTTSNTGLAVTCSGVKGMEGNRPANAAVKIYSVTSAGITLLADDNTTTYKVTYPSPTTWRYDAANGIGNPSACSGGSNDIADGSYMLTATESGKCESAGIYTCIAYTATATPVITQINLYAGATTVSGTAAANATVRLYNNGKLEATTTANASGIYSFTGLALAMGDVVNVIAQSSAACVSAAAGRTVTCYTTPPVISTDNNGNLSASATAIAGTSCEPAGTIVTILENGVSISTATVQSNGTWSHTYTPVSGRSYTATQQNGSCAASTASAAAIALTATTVCPSISGSYTAGASSVTGTMPSAFTGTIRLYQDGVNIGSASISSATAWSITVNTTYSNTLYTGGVLTVTAQASGGAEKTDCSSTTTVSCSSPATPVISPTSATITVNDPVTFDVSNSVSGVIYAVTDAAVGTTNYATSKFGAGGSLSLPTASFSSAGTYNVLVQAISLSGPGCFSTAAATITVNNISLPVSLLYFTGRYANRQSQLEWATASEQNTSHFVIERSNDGRQFNSIDRVTATGTSSNRVQYSYTDKQPVTGSAWYRLKMMDNDGQYQYSQVIRLVNSQGSLSVLAVMPNPFENSLQLQVNADKAILARIRLTDMTGREVFSASKMLVTGNNMIQLSSLSALAKGMYVLQILDKNEVIWKQKVEKVK